MIFCISALGLIYNRNYIVQNYKVSRGSNFHTARNAPWSGGLFKYVVITPPKGISLEGNVNIEYLNKLFWKPHVWKYIPARQIMIMQYALKLLDFCLFVLIVSTFSDQSKDYVDEMWTLPCESATRCRIKSTTDATHRENTFKNNRENKCLLPWWTQSLSTGCFNKIQCVKI